MFSEVTRLGQSIIRAVNITCVVLLAGIYVFTYYDYLTTMTINGGITISAAHTEYVQAERSSNPLYR